MSAAAHQIPSAWDPKRYAALQGYADDILGIVGELDLRDVTFVGHSVAAMMGVLAVATDPSRFARLVLLTPSPCYLDQGDYRGGFSRTDIDDLLDSLESNYLGWSRSMAPVIMGTPDQPELCRRAHRQLLSDRSGLRPGIRAHHIPVRQSC